MTELWTKIYPAGDQGFSIQYGDDISPQIHERIFASLRVLDQKKPEWIVDAIPSYCSILVLYDSLKAQAQEVRVWIEATLQEVRLEPAHHRVVEIPVWYAPEVAPDLQKLAQSKVLSVEQLIQLHTTPEYLVYMLGFKPGFPFLGGLDKRLWTQRLAVPRLEVPAGSVGIGGKQTGIYPVKSPGGWHIIGRTPIRIFDLTRENCFRVLPGDKVKFVSIDERRFRELLEGR